MAPFRKTFSRPVNSWLKPVPTSSRLPTRPYRSTSPSVISVIRDRIFNRVLFPAPLLPMSPSASPRYTSKLMSLSAQNSSRSARANGRLRRVTIASPSVVGAVRLWRMVYAFPIPRTAIARASDDIGKPALRALEDRRAHEEDRERTTGGPREVQRARQRRVQQRRTETLDQPRQRIHQVKHTAIPLGQMCHVVRDRTCIEQKRDDDGQD